MLQKWDELKRKEKHQNSATDTLCAVPKGFPALMRAEKIQRKARKVGFDWNDASAALPKVEEELGELRRAIDGNGSVGEEAGDLLFAAVNVIRLLGLDSEQMLHDAADKFIRRFSRMEQLANADGFALNKLTLKEQDRYWEQAKKDPDFR